MVIVMMGVSGCGKSTLGRALAEAEGWDFQEGDDLHPQANVDKMRAGEPLDDADRAPWLARIARWMGDELRLHRCGVITCSALKQSYRERLSRVGPGVRFIHIEVSREELQRRLLNRDHFMPAALLGSQWKALETPVGDRDTLVVSGEDSAARTLTCIRRWIADQRHRDTSKDAFR